MCAKNQLMGVQGSFEDEVGCVDQVFTIIAVCENYLDKSKIVYLGFIDLKKAYDKYVYIKNFLRMYSMK